MSIQTFLSHLLGIPSPSGYTHEATKFIADTFTNIGFNARYTRKGALVCSPNDIQPRIAFAAHTDTLGLIVSGINSNGTLAVSMLGGPLLPTFEGSYVSIHTRHGKTYSGTLLLNNPSAHANNKAATIERTTSAMHVRIDDVVAQSADVSALGIEQGDIVSFEPKTQMLENGFIKSHFLDNKISCAVLYGVAMELAGMSQKPPIELFFSTYEEVGHGGAIGYSSTVEELVVLDMGVVGDGCGGKETMVSICAKDSGGPYDYSMRTTLTQLAASHSIPYAVDVYPFYSSDGTAAWRAGVDVPVALIGPGVHASHGMERTHMLGVQATIDLCLAYIKHRFG
jgi:putative aminopeptidase FrvX